MSTPTIFPERPPFAYDDSGRRRAVSIADLLPYEDGDAQPARVGAEP